MFQKGEDALTREEYIGIIRAEQSEELENLAVWLDFPISNLYEGLGRDRVEFVHKTIYEYFVAAYLYRGIEEIYDLYPPDAEKFVGAYTYEKDISTAEPYDYAAKYLCAAFCKEELTDEICCYLKEIIRQGRCDREKCLVFYHGLFGYLLEKGMTICLDRKYITNVFDQEVIIFFNMLKYIHLWIEDELLYFSVSQREQIAFYLRLLNRKINRISRSALMKMIYYMEYMRCLCEQCTDKVFSLPRHIDLSHFCLREINLEGCYLVNADLRYCDLSDANLKGACLIHADFRKAILRGADLRGAILRNAKIEESQLHGARHDYEDREDREASELMVEGIKEAEF